MKKLAAISTLLGSYLTLATSVLAQVDIKVEPPQQGVNPAASVGLILSNALIIVFVIAAIAVLFMLIWGAFQWITSGGDKEAVGKARNRIMQALVGLAILALAFLITRVVGSLVGIDILSLKLLPRLDQCQPGLVFDPSTGICVSPRPFPSPIR